MGVLAKLGYIGLFIGTFLSSSAIPLPLSSDILLIGAFAAGGNVWISVAVATAGNWMGFMSTYGIGRQLGKWRWIEKKLRIKRAKIEKQKARIEKYRSLLAFIVWVPVAGEFLALGLGFYRIRFIPTASFMLLGAACRFVIYALVYTRVFG